MFYKLILASQSPRRKSLLEKAGFKFTILPANISETPNKNLNLDDQILQIALEKAEACLSQNNYLKSQNYLVLSADTMVIVDGVPYGKPSDREEAARFLRLLSGRGHLVKTGICLLNCRTFEQSKEITTTEVYFRNLVEAEIQEYISSGEPMDKAGAYGIQGLGGTFIEKFVGPFDNVVGLSMESLNKLLDSKDWKIE